MAAWFARPEMGQHHRNHCEAAELMAKRLELGPRVVGALTHAYERWDGMGTQQLAAGEAISLPMRVVHVAWQVGQESTTRGADVIAQRLRRRAGRSLDPVLTRLVADDIDDFLAGLDEGDLGQQLLAAEPGDPILLSRAEHERIRLHSYFTERIFAASPVLAPVGALGAAHHERLDGSGYHRGLHASGLSAAARLLAAANTWCSLTETRPHRQAKTESEAFNALRAKVREGLLDRNAVDAVTTSVGQRGTWTRRAPAITLTEREVDVLRLVPASTPTPRSPERSGSPPRRSSDTSRTSTRRSVSRPVLAPPSTPWRAGSCDRGTRRTPGDGPE